MLVEALGYGNLVAGATSSFSDTKGHWAAGYVTIASGTGLVVGYPNGTFQPDKAITYDEALTMVVRALGYTDASLKGTWPTNYKVKAIDLDLTDDVVMKVADADRGGVAQIIYNALETVLVEVDADNVAKAVKKDGEEQMLIDKIGNKYRDTIGKNNVNPDHDDYLGNVIDVAQYMYQEIKGYTNDDGDLVFVTKNYSDTVTGIFEAETTKSPRYVGIDVDGADNEYQLVTGTAIKVFYNGEETTMTEAQMETYDNAIVDLKDAKVTAVLNDDDQITALIANKATFGARILRTYKADALKVGTVLLPLDSDGDVDLDDVTVTGAVDDIFDIELDDVVVAYAAKGTNNDSAPSSVKLVVVRDTVEGKITEANSDLTKVYIDGKEFKVSKLLGKVDSFAVGNEGTFFLDDAGKVFAKEASTASDAKDYAIIIEEYDGLKSGSRYLVKPEIKLINAKGEVVTYVVDKAAELAGVTGATEVLDATDENINTNLTSRALIKFKLDSDGEISKITLLDANVLAAPHNNPYTNLDTTKATFEVADNAPIFNVKTGATTNKADYSVVDVANLPKEIDVVYSETNADGQFKVIVANNAETSVGNFAFITVVGSMLNDDDDVVAKVTAYVNGVKTVIEAEYGVTVTSGAIDTGVIVDLTLDDGKLSANVDAPFVTANTTLAGKDITKSSIGRIGVANRNVTTGELLSTTWVELEDDAVVYVVDSDGSFVEVGDVEDLVGYEVVALYDTTSPTDNEYDIIIVK